MIYAIRVVSVTGSFSKIVTSPDRAAARRYAAALIRALRLTSAHRRFIVEPLNSSARLDSAKKLDRASTQPKQGWST